MVAVLGGDWYGEGVWDEDAGVSRRRGGAGGGEVEAEECCSVCWRCVRERGFVCFDQPANRSGGKH